MSETTETTETCEICALADTDTPAVTREWHHLALSGGGCRWVHVCADCASGDEIDDGCDGCDHARPTQRGMYRGSSFPASCG